MNIKLAAFALLGLFAISCKQDVLVPEKPTTPQPETPSKGSADFTTFVSLGNSLTAGYQAGALFTDGQNNSYPKILSQQFSLAQGSTVTFNQPDINSVNGFNSTYSNIGAGVILGRLVLFAADGIQAHAVPTPAGYPGVPAPYNTAGPNPTQPAFMYTGDTTKLNNFGVPGIILVQCLTPDTGTPGKAAFNPYYYRFASKPGVSTILGDAIRKQPTFFTFDLGNNDVLGYATTGGDGSIPLTSHGDFLTYFTGSIQKLMAYTTAKGVVTTIPNVTTIPFFYTVKWNPLPLDQASVTQLMDPTAGFGGYNTILSSIAANQALLTNFGLSASDLNSRKVNYTVSATNALLIKDETLTDLGPVLDYLKSVGAITAAQRNGMIPYQQVRQTTSTDLIPLTAGGVIGKAGTFGLLGVSEPLGDKYALIPSETTAILQATADFNAIMNTVAGSYSDRVGVVDLNAAFTSFVTNQAIVSDGVMITPTFTPPFGAFSEDGVHPNSRGYAYMANIFIDAINAKFGAKVPKASLADYQGVGLPLVP